eukprot:TCONS_00007663-protein
MTFLTLLSTLMLTALCFSHNGSTNCLYEKQIFIVLDVGLLVLTNPYRIWYSYDLLMNQLTRRSCNKIWLYSKLKKDWIQLSNESEIQIFFDYDALVMASQIVDANELEEATLNLTINYEMNQRTLIYIHDEQDRDNPQSNNNSLDIAERLVRIQNIENQKVFFSCLGNIFGDIISSLCNTMQQKLPKRQFLYLPYAYSKWAQMMAFKHTFDDLENPNLQYENIKCVDRYDRVPIFFVFSYEGISNLLNYIGLSTILRREIDKFEAIDVLQYDRDEFWIQKQVKGCRTQKYIRRPWEIYDYIPSRSNKVRIN